MSSLVVVGSVAIDSIKTPFGERARSLGGSATHFSVSSSFFTDVSVVAVIGEDFTAEDEAVFHERKINTDSLQRVPGGKTFRWAGEYSFDLNTAKTLDTQLNVFADFKPQLDERQKKTDVLFLANIQPELQMDVLKQYPDIKVITVFGKWDDGTAQKAVADAVAVHKNFDGMFVQGGSTGAVRALIDAKHKMIPVAGEAENGFRKLCVAHAKDGLVCASLGQSPGLHHQSGAAEHATWPHAEAEQPVPPQFVAGEPAEAGGPAPLGHERVQPQAHVDRAAPP